MEEINVAVFSEMGHITTEPYPPKISLELLGIIMKKAMGKFNIAIDTKGLRCTYHILADGVSKNESFVFENKIVNITWDFDMFDPEYMKWPSYK